MQRPWTKHHRILYLPAGCARVEGEPKEAVLEVVFKCIGEFMNLDGHDRNGDLWAFTLPARGGPYRSTCTVWPAPG
jgi:hypothetical protein